jgi:hypothetical protein
MDYPSALVHLDEKGELALEKAQFRTVQCNDVLCCAVLRCRGQYPTLLQSEFRTALLKIVQHSTVLSTLTMRSAASSIAPT